MVSQKGGKLGRSMANPCQETLGRRKSLRMDERAIGGNRRHRRTAAQESDESTDVRVDMAWVGCQVVDGLCLRTEHVWNYDANEAENNAPTWWICANKAKMRRHKSGPTKGVRTPRAVPRFAHFFYKLACLESPLAQMSIKSTQVAGQCESKGRAS